MTVKFNDESRGVSDVIGYIQLFAMILLVATTATTVGFGQISSQQQIEQISTVENGFELLDRDVEAMQRYGDAKKQTPLNIQTGSVGYDEPKTNITIGERSGGSFTSANTSVSTTPIIYRKDTREIVYEAGLVFNNDENGGVLSRREMSTVIGANRGVLPVVVVNPTDSTTAVSPGGEVIIDSTMVSDAQSTDERTITTDGDTVWVEIKSERAEGWVTQLEKEGFTDITRTGDTVLAKVSDGTNTPTTVTLSTTVIQTDIST